MFHCWENVAVFHFVSRYFVCCFFAVQVSSRDFLFCFEKLPPPCFRGPAGPSCVTCLIVLIALTSPLTYIVLVPCPSPASFLLRGLSSWSWSHASAMNHSYPQLPFKALFAASFGSDYYLELEFQRVLWTPFTSPDPMTFMSTCASPSPPLPSHTHLPSVPGGRLMRCPRV